MKQVVALEPSSADAHVFLAIALADACDLQSALKETETAIRLAPESPSARFSHRRVLFDLGRTAEARAGLETACRLEPNMREPQDYLALFEKNEGHYNDAAGLLQTGVKKQPGSNFGAVTSQQNSLRQSQTSLMFYCEPAIAACSYNGVIVARSIATVMPFA